MLILSPNIIGVTEGRQCYVCGVDSDAVFRLNGYLVNDDGELYFQNPSAATTTPSPSRPAKLRYNLPPSCLEFDGSDSLHEFVRECPDGYEGCLTQIDGKSKKNRLIESRLRLHSLAIIPRVWLVIGACRARSFLSSYSNYTTVCTDDGGWGGYVES